ncbi:hypothetical protein ABEB36_009519 [Hypothenemus hampei]|uniref:MADF domain-containing protein n=1 Tax=Hypothenemus hampei TaxID=57062 RepID=A0ABD1EGM0_HYPHA
MEILISEVQTRNLLWNKRNPRYKDRLTVDKEWDNVSERTGMTSIEEEAKRKWRNLRDQFIKELKKIPKAKSGCSQDCSATYSRKWQYFTNLLFLKDSVTPRNTEGNILPIDTSENTQSFEISEEEDLENISERVSDSISSIDVSQENLNKTQTSRSKPILSSWPKKKIKRNENLEVEQKLLEIENKKLSLLQTPEDENLLFLRSLHPYMKRLYPFQQLRNRSKFQEILLQELSQIDSKNFHSTRTYSSIDQSTPILSNLSNISSCNASFTSAYSNNPSPMHNQEVYDSDKIIFLSL